MRTLLSLHAVSRSFAARRAVFTARERLVAVRDVSLDIAEGTTFGIVGESGCGKSTLARLALGLLAPDAGRVAFDGIEVSARRDPAWRRRRRDMQMVYQSPLAALNPRRTVGHQLAEPALIHPGQARGSAQELAELVGLSADLLARFPHELSGGQRQRVVIGRALALRPRLVVCDEPVSALDVSIAAQIINLLRDLQHAERLTYLFISHDLKVVRQIAQTVGVMYLGRLVEIGPPDQVFFDPRHPYTEALVSAIPDARRASRKRILLKGDPPRPTADLAGCAFRSRCVRAAPRCAVEAPTLRSVDGRDVACHFPAPPVREAA